MIAGCGFPQMSSSSRCHSPKRMRAIGKIEIPQEAFLAALKVEG
jgi:translation elongation factor EF-4